MSTDFKIKTISANEQIFDHLKNEILNGRWSVGEKIPSEQELAEKYGVTKITIRMAVKQLVALGILEIRTGDGTYVKEFDFGSHMAKISDFYMTEDTVASVYEFREVIELQCAKLCIEKASDEEIDELGKINEDYQQIKLSMPSDFSDIDTLIAKDIEFHNKIVKSAHNELLSYAYDVAREPINQYVTMLLNRRVTTWKKEGIKAIDWNDMHNEIFAAIKNRNYEECEKAYLKMVDFKVKL